MKDYAAMSDQEVSRLVGDVLGVEWANLDENYHELCYWPELDDELRIFDPCNNPADAWPIIVGKKLSLINADDKWLCVPEDEPVDGVTGDAVHMIYSGAGIEHANPLRAAMIVFLMMKEGE